MRWFSLVALVVLGCAKADTNRIGGADANGSGQHDAPRGNADAPKNIDAPSGMQAITLTETANNTIGTVGMSTISCNNSVSTSDNQWYRIFQLSDFPAITGALQITSITFGVEQAGTAGPVTVKVGSYSGALDGATINSAQVTALAQATTTPPDTSTGEIVTVNLSATIPANGKFVVEVSAPALTTGFFVLGSTTAAETHNGYWSSAGCNQSTPETESAATQTTHDIINVNGTH
jgi:hypothetical protein